MKWLLESNRWKHLVLAIPLGFLFTILFAIGCGTGIEFKDCHYDPLNKIKPVYKWTFRNWDWLDWGCTAFGGLIGQLLMIVLLLFII